MKAFQLQEFGKPLKMVEVSEPVPTGTEVLIEVTRCGVCHTDLHLSEGYYNNGGARRLTLAERGINPPMVLGHEIAGTLIAAGPDAPIEQAMLGRNFVIYPWIGCGTCHACVDNMDNMCASGQALGVMQPGGYQEKVLVPHPKYLVDAEGLDPALAATYACSGLTAFAALKKLPDFARNRALLLVGNGGVGQSALLLAQALGYKQIVVADVSAARRDDAIAMGAVAAVDPESRDGAAVAQEIAGPIAAAIDFVGTTDTARWASSLLCRGGTYVVVGLYGGEIDVYFAELIMKAQAIVGSYTGSPREFAELISLVRSAKVAPLRTELLPRRDVNEALTRLASGRVAGRIVLDCSTE